MVEAGSPDRRSPLRRLYERLLSPPLATGSTRLQIARASDGSWIITEPAATRPLRRVVSREQALMTATSTLKDARGGQIEVTEDTGAIDLILVPKGKKPWWRATESPLSGLFLGLLWLGLFAIRALNTRWPLPWSYETFALIVTGVCAALYLASTSFRLVRRRQARLKGGTSSSRGTQPS